MKLYNIFKACTTRSRHRPTIYIHNSSFKQVHNSSTDYTKIVAITGNSGWNGHGNGNTFHAEWHIHGVAPIRTPSCPFAGTRGTRSFSTAQPANQPASRISAGEGRTPTGRESGVESRASFKFQINIVAGRMGYHGHGNLFHYWQ